MDNEERHAASNFILTVNTMRQASEIPRYPANFPEPHLSIMSLESLVYRYHGASPTEAGQLGYTQTTVTAKTR